MLCGILEEGAQLQENRATANNPEQLKAVGKIKFGNIYRVCSFYMFLLQGGVVMGAVRFVSLCDVEVASMGLLPFVVSTLRRAAGLSDNMQSEDLPLLLIWLQARRPSYIFRGNSRELGISESEGEVHKL